MFEGEFDVGVRIGRLRDSSLIARKIAPIRLAVCAAPDYLARHGVPKTPDDLPRHDCLEYTYFESRGEWRLLKSSSRLGPLSREQCRFAAHNCDCGRRHHPAADLHHWRRSTGRQVSAPVAGLSAAGARAACALSARPAPLGQVAELCGFSGRRQTGVGPRVTFARDARSEAALKTLADDIRRECKPYQAFSYAREMQLA